MNKHLITLAIAIPPESPLKVTLLDCWWEEDKYTCKFGNIGEAPTEQSFRIKITHYHRTSEDAEWEKVSWPYTYTIYRSFNPGQKGYTQPEEYPGRPCIRKHYFKLVAEIDIDKQIKESCETNNVDTLEYSHGLIETEDPVMFINQKTIFKCEETGQKNSAPLYSFLMPLKSTLNTIPLLLIS